MPTRTLLLLRHGKSAWNTEAAHDYDRPLKSRGRMASRTMGEWLVAEGLRPDRWVSSTATRARETTAIAAQAMDWSIDDVVWEDAIYEASVETLLGVIATHAGEAERLLLVGHNPGFEWLIGVLGGEAVALDERGKGLPTCGLGILTFDGPWDALAPGAATDVRVVRPRELDGAPREEDA